MLSTGRRAFIAGGAAAFLELAGCRRAPVDGRPYLELLSVKVLPGGDHFTSLEAAVLEYAALVATS